MLSVVRFSNNGSAICIAGSKTGRIYIWELSTGLLLGEIESAHYMDVNDLDIAVTNDLVITGGKDFKVKVWIISE
jgi:pre-rRNA-processing protein IPI3